MAVSTTVIHYACSKAAWGGEWLKGLLARKPAKLASIALANTMARIAWAVLCRSEVYRKKVPLPAAG